MNLRAVFGALLLTASLTALAQTPAPRTIGFMGVLTSASGQKQDGPVAVTLSLYDTDTGGTALWSESQTVNVTNGLFSTALGKNTPLPPALDFSRAYFVGVFAGQDAEMKPRIPLQGVPYALFAHSVAAGSVGPAQLAEDPASLAKVSGGLVTRAGNNIGIGTDSPGSFLSLVRRSDSAAVLLLDSGQNTTQFSAIDFSDRGAPKWGMGKSPSNDFYIDIPGVGRAMTVTRAGRVGFGTSAPTASLEVNSKAEEQAMLYLNGADAALRVTSAPGRVTLATDQALAFSAYTGGTDRMTVAGNGLKVNGDVTLGAQGDLQAAASDQKLRIVEGTVTLNNSTPIVSSGSGFTIQRLGVGHHRITYTVPFTDFPAVAVTPFAVANGLAAQINNQGNEAVEVFLTALGGNLDVPFTFTAIGRR